MSVYKTILGNLQHEILPIKKSRFIANAFVIKSEQDVTNSLQSIRDFYPDANHHCWAYMLAESQYRFNDDGEPSGSAGKPILSHIQGNNLSNILIVVTRYFGGTKLGVGGLIRAYGQAAKEVIGLAEVVSVKTKRIICIDYEYSETANIDLILKKYHSEILGSSYLDTISMTINVNESDKQNFIKELDSITKRKVKILIKD